MGDRREHDCLRRIQKQRAASPHGPLLPPNGYMMSTGNPRAEADNYRKLMEQSLQETRETEHLFTIRWRIAT